MHNGYNHGCDITASKKIVECKFFTGFDRRGPQRSRSGRGGPPRTVGKHAASGRTNSDKADPTPPHGPYGRLTAPWLVAVATTVPLTAGPSARAPPPDIPLVVLVGRVSPPSRRRGRGEAALVALGNGQ